MKLYYTPGACSQAPHIALRELGLTFDTVKVDLAKHTLPDGSDFRAINPKGYVPLLELDDGTRLSEASVILQYVADQKPGTIAPVFGTLERWKLMEWIAFISTEVHKGFGPLWNPKTPAEVRESTVRALGNRFTLISQTLARVGGDSVQAEFVVHPAPTAEGGPASAPPAPAPAWPARSSRRTSRTRTSATTRSSTRASRSTRAPRASTASTR